MYSSLSFVALLATTAFAKTIVVTVGKGGLIFSPDTITAAVGDVVEYHFYSSLHTVVQGDFNTPCSIGSVRGFASGRINNTPAGTGSVFQVTIKDTSPMWFYCSTPSHCQAGLSGVINPPSSGNTLDAYKAAAMNTQTSEVANGTPFGGVVVAFDGSSPATSASSSAAAPAMSSSSAAPVVVMSSSTTVPVVMSSSSSMAMMTSSMAAAAATTTTASVATSAASSAATTKPSQVTTSGAGSPQGVMRAVGAGTLLSVLFGMGFVVFMA